MDLENWLPVKGYEGFYEVSDLGRVRSFMSGKAVVLKPALNTFGYPILSLYKNKIKKMHTVHSLVAITFLGHIQEGHSIVINHINFNRQDNRLVNLELVTARENCNKKHIKSASKYTGVSWHKLGNKWKSRIQISGKSVHLGLFNSEIEAHYAYEEALAKIKK